MPSAISVLTDYDYIVYHEDKNLVSTLEIEWTLDDTWNYIILVYQDADGRTQYITPDDDANLKNTASIDEHGQRDYRLHIPGRHATSATAINAGRRFLAQHKDRQFRVSPFTVQGYIKLKNGNPVPACEIRAGKRVKFGDYIDDGTGTWQTHVVTGTDYDDTAETCRVSVGKPDLWGIYSAQLERRVGGR